MIIGEQPDLTDKEKAILVKDKLRFILGHPRRAYALSRREPTELGSAYSDTAIDAGEVHYALGQCTTRQQRILALCLGWRKLTHAEAAAELGVSLLTVRRDAAEAIRRMARLIWGETPQPAPVTPTLTPPPCPGRAGAGVCG